MEQATFEKAQQERGLILFEGDWMKPADRHDILAARELDKLEQERVSVELEEQKAELRKAQLQAEQERQRLESPEKLPAQLFMLLQLPFGARNKLPVFTLFRRRLTPLQKQVFAPLSQQLWFLLFQRR